MAAIKRWKGSVQIGSKFSVVIGVARRVRVGARKICSKRMSECVLR